MQSALARIPVPGRRQAMDWSLALISQGIESTIEAAEGRDWGLLVMEQDHERALQVIDEYRAENQGWPWQQKWTRGQVVFDWGSLAWVLLLGVFFWVGGRLDLQSAGIMDNLAVRHGEWWRICTAIWLHADAAHLITNAVIGFVLLGLTMGSYGTGLGLMASWLTGVGGNLAVYLLGGSLHRSLGASGMVLGSLGLLAIQSFSFWSKGPQARRHMLGGVAGGFMLFVLLGLAPESDVLAHLGGFASGMLLGGLITPFSGRGKQRLPDLLAGLIFAAMVLVTWWLALNGARVK